MRVAGWLVAAALALVLGLRECAGDREAARIAAQADTLAVAVDSLRAAVDSAQAADSAETIRWDRALYGLRANLNLAQAANDSLLGIPVPDSGAHTPDSSLLGTLRQQNVALRLGLVTERTAARALLAQQDSLIAWQGERIRYWQGVVEAKDQQLRVAQRLLHDALAAKRPSHFWRGVAIGGALVAGYVALRP